MNWFQTLPYTCFTIIIHKGLDSSESWCALGGWGETQRAEYLHKYLTTL